MDRVLLELFRDGQDPHKRTAAELKKIPLDQVTKELRQQAKPFNFGFIYGLGPKKMVIYAQTVYGVTLTLKEAYEAYDRFFRAYRGVKVWQEAQWDVYKPLGRVYTDLVHDGRYRYLGHRAHNEYLNSPIQGAGAIGLKRAAWNVMRRFHKKFDGRVKLNHMVHDELIAICPDEPEMIRAAQYELEEGMKEAMYTLIHALPVEADSAYGYRWSDGK